MAKLTGPARGDGRRIKISAKRMLALEKRLTDVGVVSGGEDEGLDP